MIGCVNVSYREKESSGSHFQRRQLSKHQSFYFDDNILIVSFSAETYSSGFLENYHRILDRMIGLKTIISNLMSVCSGLTNNGSLHTLLFAMYSSTPFAESVQTSFP
ncbi:uncharacterized protein PRCAT00005180001 [Priceomyces carsonii]|uniref:uncharacterized protein n=1 Tax=Priceomyces carsonii TaxID=28549 RepID=UPI002ED9CDA9|nr:unnamed protein product [Priceomyces carsonii]